MESNLECQWQILWWVISLGHILVTAITPPLSCLQYILIVQLLKSRTSCNHSNAMPHSERARNCKELEADTARGKFRQKFERERQIDKVNPVFSHIRKWRNYCILLCLVLCFRSFCFLRRIIDSIFRSLQYAEQDQKMVCLPSNPRLYLPPEKPIRGTRSVCTQQQKAATGVVSGSQNENSAGISDKYRAANCIVSLMKLCCHRIE
jgi:hypothetical protein